MSGKNTSSTASLVPELIGEFVTKTLYLAINRQGTLFFWPVRLPSPDGKDIDWWSSAREAADLAMEDWVRVKANMNLGAYDIFKAENIISEPDGRRMGFWDLIKIAFRDHLITPSTIRSSSGFAGRCDMAAR